MRGGARAFGHRGPRCWGSGGQPGAGGTHSFFAGRVRSAHGRVGGRSKRPPPPPHHAGAGVALVACRAGASGAGGGRGVVVEGVRGSGVWELAAAGPAQDLDLAALPGRRSWGAQEGVGASGMGCHGKEGALLSRSVDGSFDGSSSTILPFELPKRESPWSLLKFCKLSLWVGLITYYFIIELPTAFCDTGHKRGEYVRKEEAAAGLRGQTPQWDCAWELRQDSLPFVHGAFQSPQALALFAHSLHHMSGAAGTLLSSGPQRGRL